MPQACSSMSTCTIAPQYALIIQSHHTYFMHMCSSFIYSFLCCKWVSLNPSRSLHPCALSFCSYVHHCLMIWTFSIQVLLGHYAFLANTPYWLLRPLGWSCSNLTLLEPSNTLERCTLYHSTILILEYFQTIWTINIMASISIISTHPFAFSKTNLTLFFTPLNNFPWSPVLST
jgi:hypothetical protein